MNRRGGPMTCSRRIVGDKIVRSTSAESLVVVVIKGRAIAHIQYRLLPLVCGTRPSLGGRSLAGNLVRLDRPMAILRR